MNKYAEHIDGNFALIREWFHSGAAESEILNRIGISTTSLRRYRKAHPDFDRLWKECRAERDDAVEHALFRRAVGYDVETGEKPRHVPPDVKAAVFWLENRRPGRWRDRKNPVSAAPLHVELIAEEKNL